MTDHPALSDETPVEIDDDYSPPLETVLAECGYADEGDLGHFEDNHDDQEVTDGDDAS